MSIKVSNLYEHPDGGFYCLLSDHTPGKDDSGGDWREGVTYMGTDGTMRWTSRARWDERFTPVAEYSGDDEQVIMMVRRANPGNVDFDFLRVMESWHESEMSITGNMLELAVAATLEKLHRERIERVAGEGVWSGEAEITIMTEDLQRIVQTYDIERVPIPYGFTFRISKPA